MNGRFLKREKKYDYKKRTLKDDSFEIQGF